MRTINIIQLTKSFVTVIVLLTSVYSSAQTEQGKIADSTPQRLPTTPDTSFLVDMKFWMTRGCKVRPADSYALPSINTSAFSENHLSFLKIHGNIQYDFTYRSLVDTPFSQRDFAQHTLQTTMDFVVKDKYPVRLTILERRNNSPYFDNITDINVQFNQAWRGL